MRDFRIAQFLGISNIVVCINKIDQVAYSQASFDFAKNQILEHVGKDDITPTFIPISASKGDNLINLSKRMKWYEGDPLIKYLEEIKLPNKEHAARFAIQFILQNKYVGSLVQGQLTAGQNIGVGPSGVRATIQSIECCGQEVSSIQAGQSGLLTLSEKVDLKCGDWVYENPTPIFENYFCANLCWLSESFFEEGRQFELRQGGLKTICRIDEFMYKINMRNGELIMSDEKQIGIHDLFQASLIVADPILLEDYRLFKELGMFTLVGQNTGLTYAIGMLEA